MLTKDQRKALLLLLTGRNVFISGGGGVGKTTLILRGVDECRKKGKKVLLLAPTGIAASLIGGRTIHSALHLPFDLDKADYASVVEIMKEFDIIIIDEISMVSARMFAFLATCLARTPKKIQLVVLGDFYQLPPVKAGYAFMTNEWQKMHFATCILEEVVRQADSSLIHNLNLARIGDGSCIDYFNQNSSKLPIEGAIYLCARRKEAKAINDRYMDKLPGSSKTYIGRCNKLVNESELRVDMKLELKVGMRVMSVINDPYHRYQNGSCGVIRELAEEYVVVHFDNGVSEKLCFHKFEVCAKNGEDAVFWQLPLLPAYAITIHKSQGQTFEVVNIVGDCWEKGQLYVALSRAKSIDGVYLQKPIEQKHLQVSKKVNKFYAQILGAQEGCRLDFATLCVS